VNRHYLKLAAAERLAELVVPFLRHYGWVTQLNAAGVEFVARAVSIAAASVDRLDQVPARLHFLFDYSAAASLGNPDIRAEASAARP
jgi:hypothetical protein